ncbi:hypothetical protein Poli38472_003026 [Pythium oligandrum]|uniref:FYVE-type domain-containing protein n=1 Tax=Pythium oligandrum TaxID=41045 RepID=A0A8K1C624_PYTOL|nr:hypothetical protein Poli38472_003026 [Pythium oligandrum]|eukprot:TMW57101.1 hypothetical protein Poli38472_003026 [Pythium oligandrum]
MPQSREIDVDMEIDGRHDVIIRREPMAPAHHKAPASNSSSGSLSKYTRPSTSSASMSGGDEYDDDAYDDGNVSNYSGTNSSFHLASSFNVEQGLMNSRESLAVPNRFAAGRDSLMVSGGSQNFQPRMTEYGSDVMRMDDGYRSSSFQAKRINANATIDGLTPLLHAARVGDLVLLNSLIIQPGTDILRRDPVYGQTALHFAIRGGHLAIVQALVMPEIAGSIVNIPDGRRNTALHLAAAKSRRMAKVLIDAGADVNFLNMRNQTPLGVHLLTVTRDDPTMTEILLQARADANASVDKSTALHVALDKQLFQIAQRLVRHGARLDLKDESGKMVFDKVDHVTLKMLLSKVSRAPVWVPDEDRSACMECHKKFGSLGTRRHHCRYCGRLLCSKCTNCHLRGSQLPFRQRRKKDRKDPRKKQRVCSTCYEIFVEGINTSAEATRVEQP